MTDTRAPAEWVDRLAKVNSEYQSCMEQLNAAIAEKNAMLATSPPSPNIAELVEALESAGITLAHARVFIGSREKMHENGRSLYDECIADIDRALANYRGGK
jgi:hypothetical protein